ncbi:MAG: ATP-grasp domain-containing protein, partial [Anaerolineales bacterium]|nr:ATP-grasp domain-containing protein [Anaerolineales bacterium]
MQSAAEARAFAAEMGYPIIAKPDIGVGANETYKLHSAHELEAFLARQPQGYLLEPFIDGTIQSFDGLTDQDGRIVFHTVHQYGDGVLEIISQQLDAFYYSLRDIPPDLAEMGQRAVQAFGVRERFFHFEFFRQRDGSLIALEANLRPPGGFTTDMFNFANNMDVYREYANVVVDNRFEAGVERPYHCAYIARRQGKPYVHSHEDILAAFGERIAAHQPVTGIISVGMGNYGYLARSPFEEEIWEMADFIRRVR